MSNWLNKQDIRVILALTWSGFSMLYLVGITFTEIPKQNMRVVDTVLGFVLGTIVATIIAYFFGSSKGSADKNDMINGKTPNT